MLLELEPSGGRFIVADVEGQMETGSRAVVIAQPRHQCRRDGEARTVFRLDPCVHARRVGMGHERVYVLGRVGVALVFASKSLNECPGAVLAEDVEQKLGARSAPQVQHGGGHLRVEPKVEGRQRDVQRPVPHTGRSDPWCIPVQNTVRVPPDGVIKQVLQRAAEARPDIEVVGGQGSNRGRESVEGQPGQAVNNEVQRVGSISSRSATVPAHCGPSRHGGSIPGRSPRKPTTGEPLPPGSSRNGNRAVGPPASFKSMMPGAAPTACIRGRWP